MINKRFLILCTVAAFSCGYPETNFCYNNGYESYQQTENEAKEGIKKLLEEKFSDRGFLNISNYRNEQSDQDAKFIHKIVEKTCVKNKKNFKFIKITIRTEKQELGKKIKEQTTIRYYSKKWNKKRTESDVACGIKKGLQELIYNKIGQIDPSFLTEKTRIANNIMSLYNGKNENQFIGNKLTQKIQNEIKKINEEENKKEYMAKEKFKKLYE